MSCLEPLAAFGVTMVPLRPDRSAAAESALEPELGSEITAASDSDSDSDSGSDASYSYSYSGICPTTGQQLCLPRSALAEAVARGLMERLGAGEWVIDGEGKMYGVLVVETPTGEMGALKAFSGLLQGQPIQPGWVPPIPGRAAVARAEAETLAQLTQIRDELAQIAVDPVWEAVQALEQDYRDRRQTLQRHHRQTKADRRHTRQRLQATLSGAERDLALAALDRQSQQEGIQRRKLKQEQDAALALLKARTQALADRRLALRRDRKRLSRQLQTQMHATYTLTNFAGYSRSLIEIVQGQGMPTGTGDCCAPKLLHFAARQGLKPLGLAEFWWGAGGNDRRSGQFYGACAERCQPIMGFLLSGLQGTGGFPDYPGTGGQFAVIQQAVTGQVEPLDAPAQVQGRSRGVTPMPLSQGISSSEQNSDWGTIEVEGEYIEGDKEDRVRKSGIYRKIIGRSGLESCYPENFYALKILYVDQWLVVVDKPAGLLSVPGRRQWDSVLSRLRVQQAALLQAGYGRIDDAQVNDGPANYGQANDAQSDDPHTGYLQAVHRLDQDTSGILVIARDSGTHRQLSQQFHDRQVEKIYIAGVAGVVQRGSGTIDLPLWGDPHRRPRQFVDFQYGKPSLTDFCLKTTQSYQSQRFSWLELRPQTGRTHQLRVHLADPRGLGTPILGDRLYCDRLYCDRSQTPNSDNPEFWPQNLVQPWGDRLHLHAHRLVLTHPQTGATLTLQSPLPRSIDEKVEDKT